MSRQLLALTAVAVLYGAVLVMGQQADDLGRSDRQRSQVDLVIGDRISSQPRLAVPDCLALSSDAETESAAALISQVLWNDLEFEREFRMIPRDTYESVPRARSLNDVPFEQWRVLGADGVVSCSVERTQDDQFQVQARLFDTSQRHHCLTSS